MAHIDTDLPPPPQPGINGVRYSAAAAHVYYTTTGQKLFMRVAVDPLSFAPVGEPETLSSGGMYDDFCIDDARGIAYVTVHRENRIDRLPLIPTARSLPPLAGNPFNEKLIGPSSVAWSRRPGEEGRVLFVITDGGTTAPPEETGVVDARVVRVELG
jgi:Txe/YoeB family toxin of Txe-Axe toxin-antitoxin module